MKLIWKTESLSESQRVGRWEVEKDGWNATVSLLRGQNGHEGKERHSSGISSKKWGFTKPVVKHRGCGGGKEFEREIFLAFGKPKVPGA